MTKEEIQAEADKRYPPLRNNITTEEDVQDALNDGFVAGAEWAKEQLLTDESILKIDSIIDEYAVAAVTCGFAAHKKEPMPKKYADEELMVDYYNDIINGKHADDLRHIYLPKFVRKHLLIAR